MKNMIAPLIVLSLLLGGSSCKKEDNQNDTNPAEVVLSKSQQDHLLQLYEEEKLARDIYTQFYNEHAFNPFSHHMDAESTHMGFVNDILVLYGLTAPQNPPGVFNNADYQKAYNEWLPKGLADGKDACYVGGYIEEMDILDLMNAIENIAETDEIRGMYELLKSGSENHLRAYNTFIKNQYGIDYQPQIMDQALFDQIISAGGSHGGR